MQALTVRVVDAPILSDIVPEPTSLIAIMMAELVSPRIRTEKLAP